MSRDSFTSNFGIIAAAAGSAIGLGNIWRFPYITGKYGGAAFIILYLLCIFAIGLPVMLTEFVIGRSAQKNAVGSFKTLAPHRPWFVAGGVGIVSNFMILSFYSVVGGWTLSYVFKSASGAFAGKATGEVAELFTGFISSSFSPILWQVIFMILTCLIVLGGIKNGIEKYSKIMMPVLFLIIIILDIRAITLPGGQEGLEFLFKPDWAKVNKEVFLIALGQAFFTLSLGVGTMLTYGSYIPKNENLGKTAFQITIADTLIAVLAGIAIFPAVFAFGIEPGDGPGLVFITLPSIFNEMLFGRVFELMFFVLLAVAALTSSISMLEVAVAYFVEERHMNRAKATIGVGACITVVGMLASLSQGALKDLLIFNMYIFDFLNYVTANILMPLVGLTTTVFVAWFMVRTKVRDELSSNGRYGLALYPVFMLLVKVVAPILILIVFANGFGWI